MKTDKLKTINAEYDRYCKVIDQAIKAGKLERALAALSACGELLYESNQSYKDDRLESYMEMLSELTADERFSGIKGKEKTILFYDGFGTDTRGLALVYLKALIGLDYKIIYVSPLHSKDGQPVIDNLLAGTDTIKEYVDLRHRYVKQQTGLQEIILKHEPSVAFYYSLPNDTAGLLCFMQLKGIVKRFFINLTDHAFWLGTGAADHYIDFRGYGKSVSVHHRNIDMEKLIGLPFYPYIDKETEFKGFDFDTEGKKILFSGGALYKTIDGNNTYYRLIKRLLDENKDLLFLYAGYGMTDELDELLKNYRGRAYKIDERKDLYRVMKNITKYINTYPIIGGLMTQYAVAAGKIPLILKFDDESEGILIAQEDRKIEYYSEDDLAEDVHKLLSDDEYLRKREKLLEDSLITEREFADQLGKAIEDGHTDYDFAIKEYDDLRLKETYIDRFDMNEYRNNVAIKRNKCLLDLLCGSYIKKAFSKIV